jgi:hypothetical protein
MTTDPANDNPDKVPNAITLNDLAAASGIDADTLLRRTAIILNKRMIQKAACRSIGNKQCASICLSNFPTYELGECPYISDVWTDEAIDHEKARRPDGPLKQADQ